MWVSLYSVSAFLIHISTMANSVLLLHSSTLYFLSYSAAFLSLTFSVFQLVFFLYAIHFLSQCVFLFLILISVPAIHSSTFLYIFQPRQCNFFYIYVMCLTSPSSALPIPDSSTHPLFLYLVIKFISTSESGICVFVFQSFM